MLAAPLPPATSLPILNGASCLVVNASCSPATSSSSMRRTAASCLAAYLLCALSAAWPHTASVVQAKTPCLELCRWQTLHNTSPSARKRRAALHQEREVIVRFHKVFIEVIILSLAGFTTSSTTYHLLRPAALASTGLLSAQEAL